MGTYSLPVSEFDVIVQQPTGREDLLLQEARELDIRLVFALLDRLVGLPREADHKWGDLSVTDLETLLLLLRREAIGDLVQAETDCTAVSCKARIDVSFHIADYLASVKPRVPLGVEKITGEYPYRLIQADVRFRLPKGDDFAAIERRAFSERSLVQRCIHPEDVGADVPLPVRRRIERAMHALAPRLSRILSGECPTCKAAINLHFDVVQFVLREIRDHAATIFEDVHLLAAYYKWPEEDILSLPRKRRLRYGAALREQRSAA